MRIVRKWKYIVVMLVVAGLVAVWVVGEAQEKKGTAAPPIGKPRTDKDFSKDVGDLLFDRRVAVSDLPGGIAFKPKDCMRCHENEPGVEGQIFYGYPDFAKDVNWPNYIGHPEEKHAPSLKYDFSKTHEKKAKLTPKGNPEQIMKQNQ